ncbi:MAG: class II aldolase/adducin family protein [Acidobacteriota bacterium]
MLNNSPHLRRIIKRGLTLIDPLTSAYETEEKTLNIFEFLLAEPYSTITGYFLDNKYEEIIPVDSESGLFLPRIPVLKRPGSGDMKKMIIEDKIIIPSKGTILTGGEGDPEQPLILLSIACFSLFVKFFHLILTRKKEGTLSAGDFDYIDRIRMHEYRYTPLTPGPVNKNKVKDKNIPAVIAAAGREIVSEKLVDSIFGNISVHENNDVYITKAGSFLDDLAGQIVKVPLNGIIDNNLKPSSEIEVHRNIYKASDYNCIIHGHPLFTVILSLDNEGTGDTLKMPAGESIPVIDGEYETGESTLAESVPSVLNKNGNVIVKGHGIFSAGRQDFSNVLQNIKDIENYSREEYFRRLK